MQNDCGKVGEMFEADSLELIVFEYSALIEGNNEHVMNKQQENKCKEGKISRINFLKYDNIPQSSCY